MLCSTPNEIAMPLPPPPPPAPLSGPPPPPPPGLPAFGGGTKKGGNPDQARGQLLQSIRQGKTLKKTVTIDKSKPLINNSPKTPVSPNDTVNNVKANSIAARTPIDLANLFAGGMPTLKPTGLRVRGQSSSPATPPINNNASPVSLFSQTSVNNSPSNINTVSSQKNNSRGPPPQPPPPPSFHQKSTIHSSTSEPVSIIPSGVGHNRTVSVPSLVSESLVSRGAPPGGYGKPNVAPKPPSIKPTIPLKQPTNSSTNLVSRANSMREPKTPPVVSNNRSLQFSNLTMHSKNQPAFHLSQDSILKNSDNLKNTHLGYRTLRPIKHPTDRPPPPPIKAPLNPPAFAPPPPPPHRSMLPIPPPPNVPPHKSYPNNNVSNGVPPTPPTRYSSMRNGQTSVLNESLLEQMEMRFSSMFKPLSRIPPPPVFQRVDKIYNSRLVVSKHRAPKPPGY